MLTCKQISFLGHLDKYKSNPVECGCKQLNNWNHIITMSYFLNIYGYLIWTKTYCNIQLNSIRYYHRRAMALPNKPRPFIFPAACVLEAMAWRDAAAMCLRNAELFQQAGCFVEHPVELTLKNGIFIKTVEPIRLKNGTWIIWFLILLDFDMTIQQNHCFFGEASNRRVSNVWLRRIQDTNHILLQLSYAHVSALEVNMYIGHQPFIDDVLIKHIDRVIWSFFFSSLPCLFTRW